MSLQNIFIQNGLCCRHVYKANAHTFLINYYFFQNIEPSQDCIKTEVPSYSSLPTTSQITVPQVHNQDPQENTLQKHSSVTLNKDIEVVQGETDIPIYVEYFGSSDQNSDCGVSSEEEYTENQQVNFNFICR